MDVIEWVLILVWSAAAIGLTIKMGVFSPEPLRRAPARLSRLSLPILFGVTVLYLMSAILAQAAVYGLPSAGTPAATAASPTTSAPATTATSQPVDPASELEKYVFDAATKLVPTAAILLLAHFLVKGGLAGWGLSIRRLPRGLIAGFLGFLIIIPLIWLWSAAVVEIYRWFQHEMFVHETLQQLTKPAPLFEKAGYIFFAVVAAPVLEEIYFRGLVQTILIQPSEAMWAGLAPSPQYRPTALRRWIAIFIASAYFSVVHPIDHWLVLFLLSAAIGYVYERTGTLWAPMALHAAFNGSSIYFNMTGKG